MSNRKVPWWVLKEQRAKARQQLAFSNRRPKKGRVSHRKEANVFRKNDPLGRLNRGLAIGKPRPGHRPHLPVITQQAPEYMKWWQSPYAPLNGRMPEYLSPHSVLPQNPMFRRMPDAY